MAEQEILSILRQIVKDAENTGDWYVFGHRYFDTCRAAADEIEKLRRFKAYVHERLDKSGVPVDPESSHKAEGCRIGGRLDIVLGELESLRAERERLREALKEIRPTDDEHFWGCNATRGGRCTCNDGTARRIIDAALSGAGTEAKDAVR